MRVPDAETIKRLTSEVHELLAARAVVFEGSESINPETLRGLCATGAVLLQERLERHGIPAVLVAARAAFGNLFHWWVLADGLHADPTYGQFDDAAPWRVEADAPTLRYSDYPNPTTWAPTPLSAWRSASQHPDTTMPAMGLSRTQP